MNRRTTLSALLFTALAACAAPGGEQPATQPVAASPEVEQWLDRIEQRTDDVSTLRAKVTYDTIQGLLGDEQRRFGTLYYEAGPPARFAIHLDRLVVDNALRPQDRWYVFDGQWLAERIADEKTFIRRELVPPGEERDLLRIGEGPFAIPLDLEKDKVLERFEVALVEDQPAEVENSVHLRLTPRPDVDIEQEQIDIWYDRDNLLPVRVHTREEASEESVIRLRDIELGEPIAAERFDTTPPTEPGWQIELKPLNGGAAGQNGG